MMKKPVGSAGFFINCLKNGVFLVYDKPFFHFNEVGI